MFGFTNHDHALSFDGTSYEPETGLSPAQITTAGDLSVDAQEAQGALSSTRITEADILSGLWE